MLCECGCGEPIRPPARFRKGHNARLNHVELDDFLIEGMPDECWIWTGRLDSKGYGALNRTLAHREAYRRTNGPIPAGKHVLHSCDNPPCCNPAHLFLGTQADNNADRNSKERQARGERVASGKLTADEVSEIRVRRLTRGETQPQLAAAFGVTHQSIADILHRRTWRHLPEGA